MAVVEEHKGMVVVPFGIEADHPRNSDLLLQCVPGARLRSAIDGSKPITDPVTGDTKVPLDQARSLSSFPKTPGMQIFVDPANLTYKIFDPLTEPGKGERLCERVASWLRTNSPSNTASKVRGAETIEGELDEHRMKSLCREMLWMLENKDAKIVGGVLPSIDDIADLPGEFLLNPGSRVGNTQPVYERDWGEWVASLSRSGG